MATVLDTLITRISPEFVGQGELNKLESGVERAQRKLNKLADNAIKIGLAVTTAATGTVVAFARYESEIAKIEGLVGISRDQLQAWQGDIEAIAAETGKSPEELARALFFVTSAGLRGAVAMDVLRASARASAAGLGDQAAVVDLVTSAINAYGPDALSAASATDILTAAVRAGKLEPESMAGAMGRAIPVAAAMGVEFGEVAGILAAMSRTGTNVEEGVTQINAVMSALLKPTKESEKALAAAGLSAQGLRDVAAGPQGLWGVLQILKQAFGDNVDQMAEVFPNVRALRGVFDLLGAQMAENANVLRDVNDSMGVTDEAFAAASRTLLHQWNRAVSAAKVVAIELGSELAPLARQVVDFAQTFIQWFRSLPDDVRRLAAQALALGPVLIGVGAALKGLAVILGPLATAIALVGRMTGIATAAQWAWNASLVAGPGLAAALGAMMVRVQATGVAAATALNVAWSRLYLTLKFGGLKGLFLSLWSAISAPGVAAFTAMRSAAVGAFAAVKGAALGAFATLKGLTLAGLWAGVKAAGVAALAAIKGAAIAAGAALLPISLSVVAVAAIAALLIAAWRPVSTFFRGFASGLVDGWGRVSDAGGRLLEALGPVGTGIVGAFNWIWDTGKAVFGWLYNAFGEQGDAGRSFATVVIDSIVGVIDAITSMIGWFRELFGLVGEGDWFGAGAKLMTTLRDGLLAGAGLAVDAAKAVFGKIRDLLPFSDAKVGPLSRLTHSGRAIVTTIADGVRQAPPLRDALLAGALTLPPLGVPDLPSLGLPRLPNLGVSLPRLPNLGVSLPRLPNLGVDPLALQVLGTSLPTLSADTLSPPLPIGPVPPPAAAGGGVEMTVNVAEGAIIVNGAGDDAEGIAKRVGGELENWSRGLAEQMDSRFKA